MAISRETVARVLRYFLHKKRPTDKSADVALKMTEGLQVFIPKSRADVAAIPSDEFAGWTPEDIERYINTGKRPGQTEEF